MNTRLIEYKITWCTTVKVPTTALLECKVNFDVPNALSIKNPVVYVFVLRVLIFSILEVVEVERYVYLFFDYK